MKQGANKKRKKKIFPNREKAPCPTLNPFSFFPAEEVECHSTWKDGSFHFMVGKRFHAHATSDEEKYRCFIFEYINPLRPQEGVLMAQSGDATCNGLFSPLEGSTTMRMKEGRMVKNG